MEERGGGIREPLSINQEDPHDEEVCNPNCVNFLLLPLHIFADLIIGEAVGSQSQDRLFLQVYIMPLMPRKLDDQGNNNWRRLWEPNRKSCLQVARA